MYLSTGQIYENVCPDVFYQSEERDSDLASLQDTWNRFNRSGCYDSLISVTDPYLEHFLECNDTSGIMYSGLAITQAYVFKEESDSVKKYLALVEKYETEDMDPLVGILINNISGMNALKSGLDYSEVLEYYSKGLDFAEKSSNSNNAVALLCNMVSIFYTLGDVRKALECYQKAIGCSESAEPGTLSLIYMHFGDFYEKNGDRKAAIEMYRRGLDVSIAYGNMEFRKEILHKIADMYYTLGRYQDAVSYYRKYSRRIEKGISAFSEQNREDSGQELYRRIEYLMVTEKVFRMNDMSLDRLAGMTGSNRTYVSNMINRYSGMSYILIRAG